MNSFLVLLCCVFTIAAVTAIDYCSRSLCPYSGPHIGCNNNKDFDIKSPEGARMNFAKSCPADAALVNINDKLQSFIVDAHNARRNFIAGGGNANHSRACRMATMKWDNELASLAALNVKRCVMSHDKCRNTHAFHHSGQNLGWTSFNGKTPNDISLLQEVIDMWYNEVSNSKMLYIRSYPKDKIEPPIGHFTVMVADSNIRVGCAAVTYSISDQSFTTYLVDCNYATTNMIGLPIYKSCSKAASACKERNPKYKNLCSTKEAYAVNKWI